MALRNRVFVSAHTTNFGQDNLPTDRHVAYHRERAAGGVGLIITEGVRVHQTSAARQSTLGVFGDDSIPAYAAMTEAVHAEGAAMFAQLLHLGRHAVGDVTRTAAWAPSPHPWSVGAHVPHVMTHRDIRAAVAAFGAAARRVVRAGFDGIEIHAGHGHLIQQFLSPATNERTDAYGGSVDGRLRLAREVLTEVVTAAGGGTVGIRISADEFLPGGLGVGDMLEVVALLRSEFPVAFVDVSHSAYAGSYSLATQIADMSFPTAPFRHFPAAFKAAFPDLPVMAACRIDDVDTAAALVADGTADLVGMTRAHIADPHLLRKASRGERGRVRSCIACNQGCIGRIEKNVAMSCVVNPEVGFEREWHEWRASVDRGHFRSRRVLVVGAGPAGLQAAVTARRIGAQVQLAEMDDVVGGQVRRAAALTGRARLRRLVDELADDAHDCGVDVVLGRTVTSADVTDGDWDAVVVATGAMPVVEPVPGITTVSPHDTVDGIAGIRPVVAVLDETGDWSGSGVAEHLAAHGHEVHLLSPVAGVAWNITTYSRLALLHRLGELRIHVHPLRRPLRGEPEGLVVIDTLTGETSVLPGVATVVHARPPAADDRLFRLLEQTPGAPPLTLVGDAYAPRSALEAVFDAQLAVAHMLTDGPVLGGGVMGGH